MMHSYGPHRRAGLAIGRALRVIERPVQRSRWLLFGLKQVVRDFTQGVMAGLEEPLPGELGYDFWKRCQDQRAQSATDRAA